MKNLRKIAERNNAKKSHIEQCMRIALLHLNHTNQVDNTWLFDARTQTYQRWFEPFEVNSYEWEHFIYDKLVFDFKGCELVAMYDNWNDTMLSKVIIPANNKDATLKTLVDALNRRRRELKEAWLLKVTSIAKDYFNIHKDEYIKYPTVCQLISKSICVWTNGADKTGVKPCHKIAVQLLNRSINHSNFETLDDKVYSPALWISNQQIETIIPLKDGFLLHLRRNSAIHEDLLEYPAIFAQFEMTDSKDDAFSCALEAQRLQKRVDSYTHFEDFVRSFKENNNWFLSKDNKVECIVPIIWQDDTDFILRMAKMTYGDEYFFEIVEREIPLFDEIHKCIHCVLL